MVAAMTRRAVPMPPSVVTREQVVEGCQQVVIAAGTRLDDRHSCGGVRDEHVQQAVLLVADERLARTRQVVDDGPPTRPDRDRLATHTTIVACAAG